jgi:O-succinylbenzoate synthase
MLQVDANTAYRAGALGLLSELDAFDLLLVEQPFDHDDLHLHAELARRMRTPICLDESLTSAKTTATAIRAGACEIANIKAGRVGGYLEARRVHDVAGALDVPVWCGGMLETGIGRAANLALASLPGFTLPGDISGSARYYREDITEPFIATEGRMAVPTGPGLGVEVDEERIASLTASRQVLTR